MGKSAPSPKRKASPKKAATERQQACRDRKQARGFTRNQQLVQRGAERHGKVLLHMSELMMNFLAKQQKETLNYLARQNEEARKAIVECFKTAVESSAQMEREGYAKSRDRDDSGL